MVDLDVEHVFLINISLNNLIVHDVKNIAACKCAVITLCTGRNSLAWLTLMWFIFDRQLCKNVRICFTGYVQKKNDRRMLSWGIWRVTRRENVLWKIGNISYFVFQRPSLFWIEKKDKWILSHVSRMARERCYYLELTWKFFTFFTTGLANQARFTLSGSKKNRLQQLCQLFCSSETFRSLTLSWLSKMKFRNFYYGIQYY